MFKPHFIILLFCLIIFQNKFILAQSKDSTFFKNIKCSEKDKEKIDSLLKIAFENNWKQLSKGDLNLKFAAIFLATPYIAGSLDRFENEPLLIRLDSLDCVTFVETVLALTLTLKSEMPCYASYVTQLESIRYRNGVRNTYASRLHYFTDWINDNQQRKIVSMIGSEKMDVAFEHTTNFMTKHRKLYSHLANDSIYQCIAETEQKLNELKLNYFPKSNLFELNEIVKEGDILAITSSIPGIDINHVGFAILKNKRVYLIHASSTGKKVEISSKPLVDYLAGIKKDTGIMLVRPID